MDFVPYVRNSRIYHEIWILLSNTILSHRDSGSRNQPEVDINSSSFAFKFWNFQLSELCCKSRAIFKIAEKRLCCDLQHNLTMRNEKFYKKVKCFPHNELLVTHD